MVFFKMVYYYLDMEDLATPFSIKIPENVNKIMACAFFSCSGLKDITVNREIPPTLQNKNMLKNSNNCPIYVPSNSVEIYKTALGWKQYKERIFEIPLKVKKKRNRSPKEKSLV